MKYLSNIKDPRKPEAKTKFVYRFSTNTPAEKDAEFERYLAWVADNHIGQPKATDKYSVEELEQMGMVGIYAGD